MLSELREALASASNRAYLLEGYDGLSSIGVVTVDGGPGYAIAIHVESKKGARFPTSLHLENGVNVPVVVAEDFVLPHFS